MYIWNTVAHNAFNMSQASTILFHLSKPLVNITELFNNF